MKPAYAAPLPAVDSVHAAGRDAAGRGDAGRGDAGRDGELVVTATKRVDARDPYMAAHFPGRPVYPGVFILETVRQAMAAVLGERGGEIPDVSAVRSLRFFHPLVPGDVLRADVRCHRGDGAEVARMSLEFRYGHLPPDERGAEPGPAAGRAEPLDQTRIRAILPHGPQMVLVDRARVLPSGGELHAVKTIGGDEPCYRHLPAGLPRSRFAYPASLIIESFGQAAAVLWRSAAGPLGGDLLMFAAARNCRFEGYAYPGDVLRHDVRIERSIAGTGFAGGTIWAGGRRVATVESVIAVVRAGPHGAGPASAGATVTVPSVSPGSSRHNTERGGTPYGDRD